MKLSIIVLTWNSEKYIEDCLDSLHANVHGLDYEIILSDNGSTDATLQIIGTKYSHVQLIRNQTNKGVAYARNQGLRAAQGDYLLLVDIDTIILDKAIPRMMEFMEIDPYIGICGPRLIYENGAQQNNCRKFPLVQTKFLRLFPLSGFGKCLKREDYAEFDLAECREVDCIRGACQLIRKRALLDVGLLDDNIFYGPEDVDLCLRMWLKGWKVVFNSDVHIIHYGQQITKKKPLSKIARKHLEGLIYYFFKHRYFFSRRTIYKRIEGRDKVK